MDEDINDHTFAMSGPPLKAVVNKMDAGFDVTLASGKERS